MASMAPRPTLYVLGNAPPGDPLDCVREAAPLLAAHYDQVHHVGPVQLMSLRSMRRQYRPGVDRLLYDFTLAEGLDWALQNIARSPGAVLLSSESPVAPVGMFADLRSAQRYASGAFRFPALATLGALDEGASVQSAMILRRPAPKITAQQRSEEIGLAVTPGAIETTYAALCGLAGRAEPIVLLAATRRDANDAMDMVAALKASHIRISRIRARWDIAYAACTIRGLIDVTGSANASSNAAFIANCIGAPVLRLFSPEGAGEAAAAFVASAPICDLAAAQEFCGARPAAAFAEDLHTLIEAGRRQAVQKVDAA
ncbi:MAG: hypothetical protein KTR21_10500 [Rhodobacteraceae bacterium]|nr:hypothetical protein [Paracoccaceae bacterium]